MQNKAWMRVLTVILRSPILKKEITFGANYINGKDDLKISCEINKYFSTLKDEATIKISNLTYATITQLIAGQFYEVEVWCGYRSSSVNKIFKGGVLYITNKLESDRTNTAIIICGSEMLAKFGQARMNLSLNSGINMYSALKYICDKAGLPNSNISNEYKKQIIEKTMSYNNKSVNQILDDFVKNNKSYISNADAIAGTMFSIFDANYSNLRVIKIDNSNITLTGGFPRLTNEGLNFHLLPTFNFMCGDLIQIDNSIVDISINNKNQIVKNYAHYFNKMGKYMITQLRYNLNNREGTFDLEIFAKNREYISNFTGA